jgi:hypothetical protein
MGAFAVGATASSAVDADGSAAGTIRAQTATQPPEATVESSDEEAAPESGGASGGTVVCRVCETRVPCFALDDHTKLCAANHRVAEQVCCAP